MYTPHTATILFWIDSPYPLLGWSARTLAEETAQLVSVRTGPHRGEGGGSLPHHTRAGLGGRPVVLTTPQSRGPRSAAGVKGGHVTTVRCLFARSHGGGSEGEGEGRCGAPSAESLKHRTG